MSQQTVPEEFLAEPARYFLEFIPKSLETRDDLPARLAGMNAVVQMSLDGDRGGTWHFLVKDGAVTVGAGDPPAAPDIGVTMTVDTWRKIRRRELNAQAGVMTGQIRIKGNLGLAIKLGPLFN